MLTMALTMYRLATLLVLSWTLPVMAFHFNLTTVPGYFLQDEPDTDPDAFNYVFPLLRIFYPLSKSTHLIKKKRSHQTSAS